MACGLSSGTRLWERCVVEVERNCVASVAPVTILRARSAAKFVQHDLLTQVSPKKTKKKEEKTRIELMTTIAEDPN